MFTNAALTAGRDLEIYSGKDTVLMGANVKANDVYMDVGQDLKVISRQNLSSSDSFGFNFTISQTSASGGVSFSDASRVYTDTPTTIIAENRLSIYTERDTYLMGAAIYSEVGNLELDTNTLVFDNFDDSDVSTSGGVNVSLNFQDFWGQSDASGSLQYHNVQAVTYATIGAGTINVRAAADGFSLDELNRDPDEMQQIVSERSFSIEIPGVNLKRWTKQVEDSINLLEAVTATVPDEIRAEGRQAVDQWRDLIFQGLSSQEAALAIATPKYRKMLQGREAYEQKLAEGTLSERNKALALAMILNGERLEFDENSEELLAIVGCGTSGYSDIPCGATSLNDLAYLTDSEVEAFIIEALSKALDREVNLLDDNSVAVQDVVNREALKLAIECAIAWAAQGGDSDVGDSNSVLIYEATLEAVPDTPEFSVWRDRLHAAHLISTDHGGALGIAVQHAQFDGSSFDLVDVVRLANSSDPADQEAGWQLAKAVIAERSALNAMSPEFAGTDGLVNYFVLQSFPGRENAIEELYAVEAEAQTQIVLQLQDLKEELGIIGASAVTLFAGRKLAKRFILNNGYRKRHRTPDDLFPPQSNIDGEAGNISGVPHFDGKPTPHEAMLGREIAAQGNDVRVRGVNVDGPDAQINGAWYDFKELLDVSDRTLQRSVASARKNFSNEASANLGLSRSDTRAIVDARGNSTWDNRAKVQAEFNRLAGNGDFNNVAEMRVITSSGVEIWRRQ